LAQLVWRSSSGAARLARLVWRDSSDDERTTIAPVWASPLPWREEAGMVRRQ
jgi:hypothetical protein